MKELRAWQQQAPRDFTVVFEKLLTKSQRTDQEEHLVTALDLDRRRVTGFFGNIQTLFEGGVIDEGFAKRTFGGGTYWFLRDVEAPMDHAKLEAMLEMKTLSAEDKRAADKHEREVLQFYERVFQ